jgi:glutathione S-transferase
MRFVSVSEARELDGLRMVVPRSWAFWAECAKSFLRVKNIEYVCVEQTVFDENRELVAWTGVRNQPQAVYNDEPVRTNWLEILYLTERLAPAPPLIPRDLFLRSEVIGLSDLICGQGGFVWQRRLHLSAPNPPTEGLFATIMRNDYGMVDIDPAEPERLLVDTLNLLATRLHEQHSRGSQFFVGDSLSAVDIYWACASSLVNFLPPEKATVPDFLRDRANDVGPAIAAALDPILLDHRDRIYDEWLELPLVYD